MLIKCLFVGSGRWGIAGTYMVLSVVLCVPAVFAAEALIGKVA